MTKTLEFFLRSLKHISFFIQMVHLHCYVERVLGKTSNPSSCNCSFKLRQLLLYLEPPRNCFHFSIPLTHLEHTILAVKRKDDNDGCEMTFLQNIGGYV
jgi:hypothetical protein